MLRRIQIWPVFLALVMPLLGQDTRSTKVEILKDLEYDKAGKTSLKLDLYQPPDQEGRRWPAVIFIHGGSWQRGDKSPMERAESLAARGYVAVSINYRLSDEAPFPAAVEDCKAAVRWLRANAKKYNVDPDRIGVWGFSAGGHLALMVGCADGFEGSGGNSKVSSKVKCVVAFYPPTEFSKDQEKHLNFASSKALVKFLGGTIAEKPEDYKNASPVTHASKDDPPTLLVHGNKDPLVPLEQSERMKKKMEEVGAIVSLVVIPKGSHGFTGEGAKTASDKSLEWLDRYLKK